MEWMWTGQCLLWAPLHRYSFFSGTQDSLKDILQHPTSPNPIFAGLLTKGKWAFYGFLSQVSTHSCSTKLANCALLLLLGDKLGWSRDWWIPEKLLEVPNRVYRKKTWDLYRGIVSWLTFHTLLPAFLCDMHHKITVELFILTATWDSSCSCLTSDDKELSNAVDHLRYFCYSVWVVVLVFSVGFLLEFHGWWKLNQYHLK